MKKRLGIFLFFDADGIADRYIEYMLRDIRKCLSELIVIVNGAANSDALRMFNSIADRVEVRQNIGFDIAAWRHGIVDIYGAEKLKEFDSLVLFNDSFFGPFYPFSEVFEEMDSRGDDFWGLSSHGSVNGSGLCPYGYRPRYIQTYFMVYEARLLHSEEFFAFWEKQPVYKNYNELAEKFVAVMTQQFADLGYTWSVLSDTSDMESEDRRKNYDQHSFNIYDMVANRRYPILKRRSFYIDKATYLTYTNGAELFRALEYVEDNYGYDTSMIFEHIMRKYDPYVVKNALCLDYVLPDISLSDSLKRGEAVVIAHLVYDDLFDKYLYYLKNVPAEIDIVITTNSEEKKNTIEQLYRPALKNRLEIRLVENRGRDISALFVGCADILMKYEYLCFVHDKKSSQKEYSCVGLEFDRLNWENMLHSPGYITNIINLMKKHRYLGLLTPFGVNHGTYFHSSIDYWTTCRNVVLDLADRLGIKRPDVNSQMFVVGTCFWCRTSAMKKLFEYRFALEDFPGEPLPKDATISHALERIFPYVAAHHGYCSGWVYNTEYARVELSDLRYVSETTVRHLRAIPEIHYDTSRLLFLQIDSYARARKKAPAPQNKLSRKQRLKQKIKSITPPFLLNLYRKIKYGGSV